MLSISQLLTEAAELSGDGFAAALAKATGNETREVRAYSEMDDVWGFKRPEDAQAHGDENAEEFAKKGVKLELPMTTIADSRRLADADWSFEEYANGVVLAVGHSVGEILLVPDDLVKAVVAGISAGQHVNMRNLIDRISNKSTVSVGF